MLRIVFLLIAALAVAPLGAVPLGFDVYVDTSSAIGQTALLELQFNPGNTGTYDPATVAISMFKTDGSLGAIEPSMGGVSGTLASAVTIENSGLPNDYAQWLTTGTYISFRLTFSGTGVEAATGADSGSTFFLTLWDEVFSGSLLSTSSPANYLLTFDVPTTGGVDNAIRFSELASASRVPEPATVLLTGAGLGLAALLSRRRR
jgi:hypothetical protein